ncbi:MAG: cation-transporting P-type ATPase [Roseburia sp.]
MGRKATKRLREYGRNELEEKKASRLWQNGCFRN